MIELVVALGAGLISFLSPCVLPLIPGYVSFVTGSSLNEILENKKINL
jgi:cytochrome c-type biogenesis protein